MAAAVRLILPQIVETWLSRPTVSKIISFGVIGLGNTVIDLAIFTLAYKVLGLALVPANVMAWLVAVSVVASAGHAIAQDSEFDKRAQETEQQMSDDERF